MELTLKPEDVNFTREEYQKITAAMRSKDYPPLMRKEVEGKVNLRHRRPNPYVRDRKALVSFVVAEGPQERHPQVHRSSRRAWQDPSIAGPYPVETELQQR